MTKEKGLTALKHVAMTFWLLFRAIMVLGAIGIGILMLIEHFSFIDAFFNTIFIIVQLGAMSPIITDTGKLLMSFFGILCWMTTTVIISFLISEIGVLKDILKR